MNNVRALAIETHFRVCLWLTIFAAKRRFFSSSATIIIYSVWLVFSRSCALTIDNFPVFVSKFQWTRFVPKSNWKSIGKLKFGHETRKIIAS